FDLKFSFCSFQFAITVYGGGTSDNSRTPGAPRGVAAPFRKYGAAARSGYARDVGFSRDRDHVLWRDVPRLYAVSLSISGGVRDREQSPRHPARRDQY